MSGAMLAESAWMQNDSIPRRAKIHCVCQILTNSLSHARLLNIMCEWACETYQSCSRDPKHHIRHHINYCPNAPQNGSQPCMPASGHLRDLPLALDVQDTDLAGD